MGKFITFSGMGEQSCAKYLLQFLETVEIIKEVRIVPVVLDFQEYKTGEGIDAKIMLHSGIGDPFVLGLHKYVEIGYITEVSISLHELVEGETISLSHPCDRGNEFIETIFPNNFEEKGIVMSEKIQVDSSTGETKEERNFAFDLLDSYLSPDNIQKCIDALYL